jgi:hypothetical protein
LHPDTFVMEMARSQCDTPLVIHVSFMIARWRCSKACIWSHH